MPKKFKVGYKTINAKLKVTRHHLNKIKRHVSRKDQKAIAAQIEAINLIISSCRTGKMSVTYIGNNN